MLGIRLSTHGVSTALRALRYQSLVGSSSSSTSLLQLNNHKTYYPYFCTSSSTTTTSSDVSNEQQHEQQQHQQQQHHLNQLNNTTTAYRILRSKLFIPMQKDKPTDSEMIKSHLLMEKTGMVRKAALGMYMNLPLAHRVLENLTRIIDEEMMNIGGQKLSMPKLLTKQLWEKTGRWESSGDELIKVKDRRGDEYCLAPTHEEIFTDVIANERLPSSSMPMLLYQIGDKYRDEIRPRFGLLRCREFLMKDMYTFDRTPEEAEATYEIVKGAYHRIFSRLGVKYICVAADSGNIGGSLSHEFQIITDVGEDDVITCSSCDYAANVEKADGIAHVKYDPTCSIVQSLAKVKSNEGALAIASVWTAAADKANLYSVKPYFKDIGVFEEITKEQMLALDPSVPVQTFIDESIKGNQKLLHNVFKNNLPDDAITGRFRSATSGDLCVQPSCNGGTFIKKRGIEVGHIFYLGTKYSKPLNAEYRNKNGESVPMEMGCYGIGVSRLMAALIESHHTEEQGIVWPLQLAPYKAIILPNANKANDTNLHRATYLYDILMREPLLRNQIFIDDRLDVQFPRRIKEATLIGVPYLIFIRPNKHQNEKGEVEDEYELVDRRTDEKSIFTIVELLYFFRFKLQ
ncbi:hypothetical protein SAMD00019534_092590 [Acytostelium subglobosum LB1]|uniref:hypothetical protein n=1 Tax=Acytostelium subglobosum LB1 TaxID=1410327 RepID=UPI000644B312|nr:hypothetical protein SAMD00019534_092590 [Acytostelium subglobosum LB1]GAM26084.1 hypothetical protein SAMD00019534_092590 [Acytostelium subglobosum LB1]|eukprot:XP_012751127.1 hypothetical protein SAMD00019534_092590 [Acytostelium subglobosum LB1]